MAIAHTLARPSDGHQVSVVLLPRGEAVAHGRKVGPLYPDRHVAVSAKVLRRTYAKVRGDVGGRKLTLAADLVVDAAAYRWRKSGRELARLAGVSRATLWRALVRLKVLGLYLAAPFDRAGDVVEHEVRGRLVRCLHYPANAYRPRLAVRLLDDLRHPRLKGGAPACGGGAEPVKAGPTLSQTPEQGASGNGFELASQGRDAAIAHVRALFRRRPREAPPPAGLVWQEGDPFDQRWKAER